MLIGADKHYKNVFSIKRILAVVIKEVVDIYRDCEIDEIVGLINSVSVGDVNVLPANNKVDSQESNVVGEATVKYDILVSVRSPKSGDKCDYIQIKLDAEMQRKSNPGYTLSKRGLYYCARMISDQLSAVDSSGSSYDSIVPVYSIWITLVNESSGLANRILSYQLRNTSGIQCNSSTALAKMDSVTDIINLFYVCIDEKILKSKEVSEGLPDIVEFVSLLFTGNFSDRRMQRHDISFNNNIRDHRKELNGMVSYISEIEQERTEGRAEGLAEGLAEGRAEGLTEGQVKGIIVACKYFHGDERHIIDIIAKELNVTSEKAEYYYNFYTNVSDES